MFCCFVFLVATSVAAPRYSTQPISILQKPSSSIITYKPQTNYVTNNYTTNNYQPQTNTETTEIILKQKDFVGTKIIDKPGLYQFGENITIDSINNGYGLVIHCDDVTIDLNKFTLLCVRVNTICHAIYIENDRRNIQIKNGCIRGFSGNGITIGSVDGSACANVYVEYMTITNNQCAVQGTSVQNCCITDSVINHNANGIVLTQGEDVIIQRCRIQLNGANSSCAGIQLNRITNAKMLNNTIGSNKSAVNCYGIFVEESNGIAIEYNWIGLNQTQTATASVAGIALVGNKNGTIVGNTCSGHNSTSTAAGIFLSESTLCMLTDNTTQNNSIGINDTSTISTNVYLRNMSIGDTSAFNVTYQEGRLTALKAYTSGLEVLAEADKYANIQIIV